MKDRNKTKEQLVNELNTLRKRVAELESLESEVQDSRAVLRQRTADLQASLERVDVFTQALATDLRGPLGLIVSFAQVLEEDYATVSGEELHHYLSTIAQRGRRMVEVIDGLLAVRAEPSARAEEGMGALDMSSIVAEALERLAYAVSESQARIVLPETWPLARGHGPWVEEVWANLLSNAIKYGGQPPQVELGATEQEDDTIRFWVRDNGPGLALEERVQLFTQPEQAQVTEYGLGLALVQRIAKKLGGQVGVESEIGEGSTFFFTLLAAP